MGAPSGSKPARSKLVLQPATSMLLVLWLGTLAVGIVLLQQQGGSW